MPSAARPRIVSPLPDERFDDDESDAAAEQYQHQPEQRVDDKLPGEHLTRQMLE